MNHAHIPHKKYYIGSQVSEVDYPEFRWLSNRSENGLLYLTDLVDKVNLLGLIGLKGNSLSFYSGISWSSKGKCFSPLAINSISYLEEERPLLRAQIHS